VAVQGEGLGFPGSVEEGFEGGVGEEFDAAFASGEEDPFAAPAEGELVRLDFLLVGCQWGGLYRGEDVEVIGLVAYYQAVAVGCPAKSEGVTEAFDFVYASFCADVPEFNDTIAADTA